MSQLWQVVGGIEKGGIVVRQGESTSSPQLADRLSTGAFVEEMALVGERLNYLLVEGDGPAFGWVSVKLGDKTLAMRVDVELDGPTEQVELDRPTKQGSTDEKRVHPDDPDKIAYSYNEFSEFANGDTQTAQAMWDESKPAEEEAVAAGRDEDLEFSPDEESLEALWASIQTGSTSDMQGLLKGEGISGKVRFQDGKTPLNVTLELLGGTSGHQPSTICEMAKLLLDHGADADAPSPPLDEAPLQVAMRQSATLRATDAASGLAVIRLLLEGRADANRADFIGETPLFEAAISGNIDACKLLISHGASPRMQNLVGSTPLEMAENSAVSALLQAAAKTEAAKEGGSAPGKSKAAVAKLDPVFDFGDLEEQEEAASPGRMATPGWKAATRQSAAAAPRPAVRTAGVSAQSLREEGNTHFKAQRYAEAKTLYERAVEMEPNNGGLHSNLAAACMMLAEWEEGFNHSLDAIRREPENVKANERCAKCLLLRNNVEQAYGFCFKQRLPQLTEEQQNSAEWQPFMQTAMRIHHHIRVLQQTEPLLDDPNNMMVEDVGTSIAQDCDKVLETLTDTEKTSPFGVRMHFGKLRACLLPMPGDSGQTPEDRRYWSKEALNVCDQLLKGDPTWPDSHHWRARCLVRLGRRREAREALGEAERCAREKGGQHIITKELLESMRLIDERKEEGNSAYKRQDWRRALAAYDAAVHEDEQDFRKRMDVELSAQLYFNRSSVRSKLGQNEMALQDVDLSLSLQPNYTKALFRRGLLYMELGQYVNASNDFEMVARLEPNFAGLHECRSRARQWVVRPPVKNHYTILGIGQDAGAAEIKRAYRAMALKWHPDKNPDNTEKAEKMFKQILEAFETLSDTRKRFEYDGGGEDAAPSQQTYQSYGSTFGSYFGGRPGGRPDRGAWNNFGRAQGKGYTRGYGQNYGKGSTFFNYNAHEGFFAR